MFPVCPTGVQVKHCNVLQLVVSRVFECPVENDEMVGVMDPCGERCSVQFYTPEGRVSDEECRNAGLQNFFLFLCWPL